MVWKKILFAYLMLLSYITSQRCGIYKLPKPQRHFVDIYDAESARFLQNTNWAPIRIYVDYTSLDQLTSVLGADYINNMKAIINKSVEIYQTLLMVKPATKAFSLPDCGDAKIGSDANNGILTDLFLFPYINLNQDSQTEAAAAHCHQDSVTKRPIGGFIELSKNYQFNKANARTHYILLLLHELFHVFGFNESLFSDFIDPNTNTALGLENVLRQVTVNGSTRGKIITPTVLQKARSHFNCSNLDGVEVENQGGAGTKGSHWESRIMLGDFMIGEDYDENVISDISLALCEDTGWYKVNYYTGGLFRFGKNEGCDFLNTNCIDTNGKVKFPNEFIAKQKAPMCLTGRSGRAESSLTSGLLNIPTAYQYFNDPSIGGYENADFCPAAVASSSQTSFLSTSCRFGELPTYPTSFGDNMGDTSLCYLASLTPMNDNSIAELKGVYQARCYPTICNSADRTISVTIGSHTAKCPTEGGAISLDNFDGKLLCPDYNLVCTGSIWCNDPLDCVDKKSTMVNPEYNYVSKTSQETTTTDTIVTPPGNEGSMGRIFMSMTLLFILFSIFA